MADRLECTEHPDRKAISYTARCRECDREFRSGGSGEVPAGLTEAEAEWSAYAVTLNQRIERLTALARRRGIDEQSLAAALNDRTVSHAGTVERPEEPTEGSGGKA